MAGAVANRDNANVAPVGRWLWYAPLIGALLALTSCGSQTQDELATGALDVMVSGLPRQAQASVKVESGGVTQTLTASDTLQLVIGTYSVTAEDVIWEEATFRPVVVGSPATVTADQTIKVEVTYSVAEGGSLPSTRFRVWSDTTIFAADLELAVRDPTVTLVDVTGADPLGLHAVRRQGDRIRVSLVRTGSPTDELIELFFDRPTGIELVGLTAFGETAQPIEAVLIVSASADRGTLP